MLFRSGFLSDQLPKQFPEIEKIVRFDPFTGHAGLRWKPQGALISTEKLYYVDEGVFSVFSYPLTAGNAATCLKEPNSIVLTASLEKSLFGKAPALGETIILNGKLLKVTGVMDDLPGNTDLRFNALISAKTVPKEEIDGWVYSYILFRSVGAMKAFPPKLDTFVKNTVNPEIGVDATTRISCSLQPLNALHFSPYRERDTPKGNAVYVNIFLVTGVLILLIAFTNSINLTIVQSFSRVMDVTIRKIYGASKGRLVLQHMWESLLIGIVATGLSFLLVGLLLPVFALVVNRSMSITDLLNWKVMTAAVGGLLLLGAGGAVYTGIYLNKVQLAGWQAVGVRKSTPGLPTAKNWPSARRTVFRGCLRSKNIRVRGLRVVPRMMLGFQFFISIGMLIAAISVYRQVNYFRHTPLGFNPDNVIVAELPQNAMDSLEQARYHSAEKFLRNTLDHDPNVRMTSFCDVTALPGGDADLDIMTYREKGVKVNKTIYHLDVDANYFPLLQIPVIRGRGFLDVRDSTARRNALVTTGFAQKAGWTQPLGEVLSNENRKSTVVGVVPEFHFSSLHHAIQPLVIFQEPQDADFLLIRVGQARTASVLQSLQENWKKVFPELPFSYSFLDEHLMQQYHDEYNLLSLLLTLTLLMIAIGCIGLVAYVSFLLRMARVDIAVRRVIGASFPDIYTLFARQFAWLLLIGFAVAAPLAWWTSNIWLRQFAYHIDPRPLDLGIALIAMGTLIGIIILRFTLQSVNVNPGRVIREN